MTSTGDRKMTRKQGNALHLWFEQLAERFDDLNLERRQVVELTTDVPWTKTTIKEILFRPIMFDETGKLSTTQLTRSEVIKVEEIIHKSLAEGLKITQPFPSIDKQMLNNPIYNEEKKDR
tara:strand:+ start:108 stop:467 length:360 start_codon:yes stop_codon:yes gene_type:complete